MSVLKYKNAEGVWTPIANYTVQPITPVQVTGTSTSDIMSQKAVTDALNTKANSADVYTKTDVDNTFLTKTDAESTYVTETEVNQNYLTKTEAQTTYVTETEVNKIVYGQDTKPESGTTVITENNLTQILTSSGYTTASDVDAKIAALVDSAPETLDTLNELAAALGDDPNFAATITNQITSKADASALANYATKIELNGKANATHTHAITDVTGLQDALNGKAASNHTHSNYATTSSVSDAIAETTFNTGHNTVTTLTNVPVTKRLVIANISSTGTLSLAATPTDGREIQIIVHSTSGGEVSLPTGSNYINMSGDSITVAANGYADINIVSDGTKMYVRALAN